jgi:AraC family transcriptional regulator of adaptative response / DNA-3-methyladenine glycosylase II
VRAILGQQISVAAARRLAGRLVAVCGEPLPGACGGAVGLTHAFPTPERVVAADLRALGMPAARRGALVALAQAAMADPQLFHPFGTVDEAIARLRTIRGIGEWTAQYIALRVLREPDAFPASDLGLLRGAANRIGARPTPANLLRRAEPWRPWRAYAAQHLWAANAAAARNFSEAVPHD